MSRLFLSLVLISCLMACPFRCTAPGWLASLESGVSIQCDCCQPVSKSGPGPSNGRSQGDCDCRNCLCQGATLAGGCGTDDDTFLWHILPEPIAKLQIAIPDIADGLKDDRFSNHGTYLNGRAARIAQQSLLI